MSESESNSLPRPKPVVSPERARRARRRFIRSALLLAGMSGVSFLGFLPVSHALVRRLRPPGALDEKDLLASCIKCGQCVQVCPVSAIRLGELDEGHGIGVPFIAAREQACDFSCDVAQCILACPTGALTYEKPAFFPVRKGAELSRPPVLKAKARANKPEPTVNLKERMGLARLTRPDACLAVQGKGFSGPARDAAFKGRIRVDIDQKSIPVRDHPYERELCDLCVTECPIDDAITLESFIDAGGNRRSRPVVREQCVGCGVCEMICPVEPSAIVIETRAAWAINGEGV